MSSHIARIENIFIDHNKFIVIGIISELATSSEQKIWVEMGTERDQCASALFFHWPVQFSDGTKQVPFRFLIEIPLDKVPFSLRIGLIGEQRPLVMRFQAPNSGMSSRYGHHYRRFGNAMGTIYWRRSLRFVKRIRPWQIILHEVFIILWLSVSRVSLRDKLRLLRLRAAYWTTKRTLGHQRIWTYNDKAYKAGDNGEYLFRYAASHDDGIRHCFVIRANNEHYTRLQESGIGIVLASGSQEAKLAALHAEQIIVTAHDRLKYLGLAQDESAFCCNLMSAYSATVFHGLNIPYVPRAVGRQRDNSVMSFCASEFEQRAMLDPAYGFTQDNLPVQGAPRFDGLVSEADKVILFAPTWWSAINDAKPGSDFEVSEYFQIYNSLLRDTRLLTLHDELGYRFQFLLHPLFSKYASSFETIPCIEVLRGNQVEYEPVLRHASVMVTDYSGVQFDFAYMRKPIVYFHHPTLRHHYQESRVFSYSRDGFGPICTSELTLVESLIEIAHRHSPMDTTYRSRANAFFAFEDHNNCKRIYDALTAYARDPRSGTRYSSISNWQYRAMQ